MSTLDWLDRRPWFPSTPVFLFLWLPAGFVLGTLTLLGPVRWWAKACRYLDLSQRAENGGVFVMLGFLFMISGYAARIITNILESSGRGRRIVTFMAVLAISGGAMAAWMHPALMSGSMGAEQHSARFTFGPYPDEMRMIRLKRDGYTIVSLLHPAVAPFEPKLLGDEKKLALRIGIPLIHVPMLPWISGNAEALATIRQLAADPARRYYVHCYLGKDRVRLVRRALEQTGASLSAESVKRRRRSIQDAVTLERGRVYRLASDVYVTGYPTEHEFMRYVLSGEIRHVVALLDAKEPEDRALIEQERAMLQQFGVPFTFVQSDKGRFDSHRVRDVVRRIAEMPKPVLVHAFLSPSSGSSPWADGFIQTFSSQRPSLPATLFDKPLRNGRANVVVTHVAIGPRPMRTEFAELARRGVSECIHVGTGKVTSDAKHAVRAGMRWRRVTRQGLVAVVRTGGPYYIYGSDAAKTRAALERAYPKPIPLTTP